MPLGILSPSCSTLEPARTDPSNQSPPQSPQHGATQDAEPQADCHDLANMALLFAMGGSYPGCWQSLDDNHDDYEDQNQKLRSKEGQVSMKCDLNEKTMGDTLLPKTTEPKKKMEERTPRAGNLSLVLRACVGKGNKDKDRKDSLIPRPTNSSPSATSLRKVRRYLGRRGRHEACTSYATNDTGDNSSAFARCLDHKSDEVEADGLYDESGFLIEEPYGEDHSIPTRLEVQQQEQHSEQPAHLPQRAERYRKFVAETGVSPGYPYTLQDHEPGAATRSPLLGVETEDFISPDARRPSPLFQRLRPEEAKTRSAASIQGENIRCDNGPSDVEPYILGSNNLRIHRQQVPRSESFVPFHQFAQEPGRFLRNARKLRRQEERRQALYEATCAARNDPPVEFSSSSRDTNMAESRDKARMERSVSLLSWEPGVIEELEISTTKAIDAGEVRRYTVVRRGSVQGSQVEFSNSVLAVRDDSELEGIRRAMDEPECSTHRAQPSKTERKFWQQPELHPHISKAQEKRLDEDFSEDIWSFVEGDDRDFTVVQQRQDMIHELPEQWRQTVSEHNPVPPNRYKYVQYDAQRSYDPTPRPEGHQKNARRDDPALVHRYHCSLCWNFHTQESVIDPSYPLMTLCDTVRVQDNEDVKSPTSETSSQATVKKPTWCWPFEHAKRAIKQKEVANRTGDAEKGLWKTTAERRKLFKMPPTPRM